MITAVITFHNSKIHNIVNSWLSFKLMDLSLSTVLPGLNFMSTLHLFHAGLFSVRFSNLISHHNFWMAQMNRLKGNLFLMWIIRYSCRMFISVTRNSEGCSHKNILLILHIRWCKTFRAPVGLFVRYRQEVVWVLLISLEVDRLPF